MKPAKFSTDHYGSEYDNHIDFLATLKNEAPQQYHALMHNLSKDLVYASLCFRFSVCSVLMLTRLVAGMYRGSGRSRNSKSRGASGPRKRAYLDIQAMAV